MLVAGIDEAGRGSLLGPLVIGCLIIDDINKLEGMGVKDSKILSREKRSILYKKIKRVAYKVIVRKIAPNIIDANNLNRLELDTIASILKKVRVDEIYIDSFDRKPRRLEDRLRGKLNYSPNIHAEHKADVNNVVVGAASIIAKVNRDNAIDKLRVYGEIGSGYPSDKHTIEFVKRWVDKYKSYPTFVRKKWKTIQRISDTVQLQLHDPYQTVLD